MLLGDIAKELIKPKELHQDIFSIDVVSLRQKGIELILLDVDNTLLPEDESQPPVRVHHWVQQLKLLGFSCALVSNALNAERLRSIASQLLVPGYYFVCKPFGLVLKSIVEKDFGVRLDQTALIGDGLVSDMLVGNMLDMYTILVRSCDYTFRADSLSLMQTAKATIIEKILNS